MADASNPWSAEGWNLTAQAAYLKLNGQARAEARARDAGTTLGGKRPGGAGTATGRGNRVRGNDAGGTVTADDGQIVKYVILKKFYVPDGLLQPPSLSTVASVQPALGVNMAAKLYREYDIPNTAPALGFATLATVTLELDIVKNAVQQMGFSTAAALTLEKDFVVGPALGVDMGIALDLHFIGVALAASPALGITTTALLTLITSLAAAPQLGVSMSVSVVREMSLGTVAPALGFGTAVSLYAAAATHFDQGMPWEQQILFNTNSSTTLSMNSLGTDASPATPVNAAAIVATKNFVYQIGGNNSTPVWFNNIYAAPINADGSLGAWASAGTIPVATSRMKVIMTKNRLVMIGGQINNGTDAFTANCYSCPINADGTLGSWVTEPSLITSRGGYSVLVNHPYVYVFGGLHGGTSSSIATVERALINDDGTLGAWASTTSLPGAMTDSVLFDTGSRVYLITGYNGTITTSAIWATKNSDGTLGSWSSTGATAPREAFFAAGFATENLVWFLGGLGSGFASVATVYSAPITSGVIGSWTARTAMPNARSSFGLALTNSRLYGIGGFSGANSVTHAAYTGGLNDYTNSSWH